MPTVPKLIVADDDEEMLSVLRRALEREGFAVTCAGNGVQAIEQLRAHPETDVLVSDIRMPEKDGVQVLTEALQLKPGIRVVLITAFGGIEQYARLRDLGAFDFLAKPFKIPDLLAVLDRALGRE